MLQSEWVHKIKQRIESAKSTKQMYPEFSDSQDKIIERLKNELKTLNQYKKIQSQNKNAQN